MELLSPRVNSTNRGKHNAAAILCRALFHTVLAAASSSSLQIDSPTSRHSPQGRGVCFN